jgi:hypothetical protein
MIFGKGTLAVLGGMTNSGFGNLATQSLLSSEFSASGLAGSVGARGFFGYFMAGTEATGFGASATIAAGSGLVGGLVGGAIKSW